MALWMLFCGSALVAQNTTNSTKDYDFSLEKSIWGKGPTRAIEPEIQVQKDESTNPFDTVDLSGLNMERQIVISQRDIKLEIKRSRVIRKTAPFIADDSHTHLGFNLIGGMSTMSVSSDFGDFKKRLSPGFGLEYMYFFHSKWGATIGMDMIWASTEFESNGKFTDSNSYTDFEGDKLTMHYSVDKIDEKLTTMMIEIPIMASYDYKDWLLSAGFKFGFPFKLKYEQKLTGVNITGEWPFSDVIKNAAAIGAGQWNQVNSKGKFSDLQTYIMLTGNFGRKFRINDMFDFGASVFIDYALNSTKVRGENEVDNLQSSENEALYGLVKARELVSETELPAKLEHASTLCSKQMSTNKRLINEFNYFNVGLHLTLYFSSYGNESAEGQSIIERLAAKRKNHAGSEKTTK